MKKIWISSGGERNLYEDESAGAVGLLWKTARHEEGKSKKICTGAYGKAAGVGISEYAGRKAVERKSAEGSVNCGNYT